MDNGIDEYSDGGGEEPLTSTAEMVANVALRGEAWWYQSDNSLRIAAASLPVAMSIKEWIGDVAAQAWTEGAITAVQEYGDEMRKADEEFDRHWLHHMRAVDAWRSANPGNDLVLPDMTEMLDWLCDEAGIPSAKNDGASDCAANNAPAYPNGRCDCGGH